MSSIVVPHLRLFFFDFKEQWANIEFCFKRGKCYKNTKNTWKFIEINLYPGYQDLEVESYSKP